MIRLPQETGTAGLKLMLRRVADDRAADADRRRIRMMKTAAC